MDYDKRLKDIEQYLLSGEKRVKGLIRDALNKLQLTPPPTLEGLQIGLCVSTYDPFKQNRVRFYHPSLAKPNLSVEQLPFAFPISAGFPSFDDSGITWVPPAGSLICLLFLYGHRNLAFYFGSVWNRDRGSAPLGLIPSGEPQPDLSFPVVEYDQYWRGKRGGYLIGKEGESQVFPPFNTWNYNGYDINGADKQTDPTAAVNETNPHIYGIKTPEKAGIIWHDGDRKCNLRWKHTLVFSSRGNFILMKDDHLHPAGQWASNLCGAGGNASSCHDADGQPLETPECCQCGAENCPGGPTCPGSAAGGQRFSNPYMKRSDECRPYKGPDTPMQDSQTSPPQARLPQSGIHIQSLSGHHMFFDDSVDQPRHRPDWNEEWDWGCNNIYRGKIAIVSATGFSLEMNEQEDIPTNRSDHNYIKLKTPCGQYIELNDHTVDNNIAGKRRGIWINSSSNHFLQMVDEENKQVSPPRMDGGIPINKAKKAYVKLRSGYGCHLYMDDANDQEKADKQFLQLLAPQGDNDRKHHLLHMQVRPSGPGLVLLRAGGVLWQSSHDSSVETVGEGKYKASKFIDIVGKFIVNADEEYVNINKLTFIKSDDMIVLGAGLDSPIPTEGSNNLLNSVNNAIQVANQSATANGQPVTARVPIRNQCGPNYCPVLCLDMTKGKVVISDRVIASASPQAECCSIMLLGPGDPTQIAPCPTSNQKSCGTNSSIQSYTSGQQPGVS